MYCKVWLEFTETCIIIFFPSNIIKVCDPIKPLMYIFTTSHDYIHGTSDEYIFTQPLVKIFTEPLMTIFTEPLMNIFTEPHINKLTILSDISLKRGNFKNFT